MVSSCNNKFFSISSSENDLLRLKIEALKNDDRYIEITARHELGMIKDGEKIIKFKK